MNRLFNYDNGVVHFLSKIIDCVYLSMLFLFSSIPVFTIGASFSALYYTVQKVIRNERGYVAGEYWHAFRTNFKQGTIIWLITLGMGIVFFTDYKFMQAMAEAGKSVGKLSVLFGILLILVALWCMYVFPYLARFENTTRVIMKNALLMAILNLPKTIWIAALAAVFGFALYLFPMLLMIAPALYTLLLNLTLEKIFRKYMSEEDKAMEDERNREYKN